MGIPCVTAESAIVRQLQELVTADPQALLTIDVENLQVQIHDLTLPVFMGQGTKTAFVSGTWDACGQLVANAVQVTAVASQLPYIAWGFAN